MQGGGKRWVRIRSIEGSNISLLHNVFRLLIVQTDASRDAVKVAISSSDQDAKRSRVSVSGESEKFSIARLVHVQLA